MVVLWILVVPHTFAATGIRRTINFQGKLVNKTTGTNIADGTYSFTFKFYDASSAGTQLPSGAAWSETQSIVVTNGIFRAELGSSTVIPTTLDFNADNLYLDITFNGETFGSRVRMTAVPYAFNAEKVGGLTVTNTTGTLTVPNGKTISFADAFTTSGANPLTLTTSGTTNATLPSGSITLADTTSSQTLTNKTIGSTGLTFSGATTDVTTGTDEAFTITPNGTGDVIVSADNDSNFQVTGTVTDTGSLDNVSITLGNDANADTVSAINVNVTSVDTGADSDVIRGITIANASGSNANVTETALYIGTGYDRQIEFGNASFATCTALETVSGILTCGSDDGATGTLFTMAGDSGSNQTITSADTVSISGGANGIDTVGTATDAVVLNLDTTEIGTTTFGSGSGFTWTFDAGASDPTIAFGSGTVNITATTTTATGALSITGNTTLGDASGDTVTSNAATWTFANDTNVTLTGGTAGLNFDTNTLSIDATNNRIGIGTTAPEGPLQVTQDAYSSIYFDAYSSTNNYDRSDLTFRRGRGSAGSAATVAQGDYLGTMSFYGYAGGAFYQGAEIRASVSGTPGGGDMPTTLKFMTSSDGSSTPTQRMTIYESGTVSIGSSDQFYVDSSGAIGAATGISSSGTIAFSGLSTNGYVKTSGGTGTLSVSSTITSTDISGTIFTLAGDSGANQTLTQGNTIAINGGTNGIDTVGTATDAVVLNLDTTEIGTTTFGSGSGITWTFDAGASDPTIAFGSGTVNITATTTTATGALSITGNTTLGDAGADGVTFNASTVTMANDTNFVLSGGVNGISFDTSTLSIDATNDRVGIGLTNPTRPLTVSATGVDITDGGMVYVDGNLTSTTNNQNALRVQPNVAPGSASTRFYSALNFTTTSSSANVTGGSLAGLYGGIYYSGTASVGNSYGGFFQNQNISTGTLTDSKSIYIDNPVNSGGGTITTNYGLYVANQTAGTSDYGLYIAGADTRAIYAAGGIQFTSLASCDTIDTDASGNLTCGTDAGGSSSFTLSGDTGSNQTISSGDTLKVAGGTNGIDTVGGATDTVTINLDTTEIGTTTFGSGSGITWTFDASGGVDPTIAFGSGTVNITATTTTVTGALSITGNTTLGDAGADTVTFNAATGTFANDTNFTLTGGVNGLSFDTTTLSIDATNDRVGIGTTAPSDTLYVVGEETIVSSEVNASSINSYPLLVNGAALAIGDYRSAQTYTNGMGIKFIDNGVAHASIKYLSSAERFDFCDSSASSSSLACDGTPALSINVDSGRVGIGTTAPGYALQVGSVFAVDTAGASSLTAGMSAANFFADISDTNYLLDPANTGTSLAVAGSVGIGTTAPDAPLHVVGTAPNTGNGAILHTIGNLTSTTNDQIGQRSEVTIAPGSASTRSYSGVSSVPYSNSGNLTGATVNGGFMGLYYDGTGIVGTATGLSVQSYNMSSGTITSNIGVIVYNPSNTGTIGTNFGMYIANQTAGTSDYGLYIAGADTRAIYAAGGIQFTSLASCDTIDTDASGNLTCGTDGGGGTFTLSGDTGSNQTISSGDTLKVTGGTNGIDTVGTATDSVVLNLDTTEIGTTTFGSGSGITWTFDAGASDPTLAFGSGTIGINATTTTLTGTTVSIAANLSTGSNFITGNGIRQFSSSSTVYTFEDTSGNDLMTLTDNGTTGIMNVTGGFQGAGLSADCDSSGSKLLWDTTNKTFSCGTDRASQTIVKTANETVANTTLQNDDHFTFAMGASETWIIDIHSQSSAAGGIKMTATAPASSTCRQWVEILDQTQSTGANQTCGSISNMGITGSWGGGGFYEEMHYSAQITTAGSAGTFNLQWAENGANATGTILYSGGWMVAYKVSGADLAEIYYTTDRTINAGTVVAFDSSITNGVQKSTAMSGHKLAGVVSSTPGIVLGDSQMGSGSPVLLALTGRVPTKVNTENGPIEAGDLISGSHTPGVGMKAKDAGYIVGRALEDYTGDGEGKISVFVNTHYADLEKALIVEGGAFPTDLTVDASRSAVTDTAPGASEASAAVQIASPSASFITATGLVSEGTAEFNGESMFQKLATFFSNVIFHGIVSFEKVPVFNTDTAGFAQINKGERYIDVNFTDEYMSEPVVTATLDVPTFTDEDYKKAVTDGDCILPTTPNECQRKMLKELMISGSKYAVTQKTSKGFVIELDEPASHTIKFSWIAIAVKDAKLTKKDSNAVSSLGDHPLKALGEVAGLTTPSASFAATSSATINASDSAKLEQ